MIVEIDYEDYLTDMGNLIAEQMNLINTIQVHLESKIDMLKDKWKSLERQKEKITDQKTVLRKNKKNKQGKEETIIPISQDQIKNIKLDYPARKIQFEFNSEKELESFYKFYKSVMR